MSSNLNTKTKVSSLFNKSLGYEMKEESMFSNIYLIGFIIIIVFSFIGYVIYYYYMNISSKIDINNNSSFYSSDIILYEPLFSETTNTINDCINICTNDIICDGITYNSDSQTCTGTKNGQLRNENSNYSAWVKPNNLKQNNNNNKDFTKSVLIGYTKLPKTINGQHIQNPYLIGYFAYSFNLTIYDIYKNYGSWRHIFHKGTAIDTDMIMSYQSWENLITDFPIQTIGIWLAPFTNNLRIAVTTTSLANRAYGSYSDAFVEKCNSLTEECYITDMPGGNWADRSRVGDKSTPNTQINTYVEYFDNDLQNIPINKTINITINFRGSDAEVYYDGLIRKTVKLDGIPTINKLNLYAMNDKSFGGEITNLIYYPDALTLDNIKDIINLSPQL